VVSPLGLRTQLGWPRISQGSLFWYLRDEEFHMKIFSKKGTSNVISRTCKLHFNDRSPLFNLEEAQH
jgi:hypothetical protein